MRIPPSIAVASVVAGMLASCASDGGSGASGATGSGGFAPLSQRLNQEQGYVQDSEGNWTARSDRRSQFENRTLSGMDRSNANSNRRFNANQYQPAEWTRTNSAAPQSYAGNTDGSGFRTTADAEGQSARQQGSRARTPGPFGTNRFGTKASREDGARRIPRGENAQIESRRDSLPEPEIVDWRKQRDLSVDQSRSILSR